MKRAPVWIPARMALSVSGLVLHNVIEFGTSSLLALETGTIPMLIIAVLITGVWWLIPKLRIVCVALMLVYGVLNLAGGAVISVLPLLFLPFVPEQTLSHYAVHVVYGLTQLPLIGVAERMLFFKPQPEARTNEQAA
jgi:hypothetical protein